MYRSSRITRTLRRSIAALGCALLLGGCTTWAEAPNLGPSSTAVVKGPLRIMRADGFWIEMEDVSVRNDSLVGHKAGNDWLPVAVALSDVKMTQRQDVDPLASVGVALVAVAAGFGAYVYLLITHLD